MTCDVFISYRHARKDEVRALYRQLEQARICSFRDEERRDDDAPIQHTTEQGLVNNRLVVAILSRHEALEMLGSLRQTTPNAGSPPASSSTLGALHPDTDSAT